MRKDLIQTKLGCWSLVMVAAGALGNAIDRVIRGFVVDMFDFRLIHFPVFNVADIFICVGGVLFILYFGSQNVLGTGWKIWDVAAFTTFLSCFLIMS